MKTLLSLLRQRKKKLMLSHSVAPFEIATDIIHGVGQMKWFCSVTDHKPELKRTFH